MTPGDADRQLLLADFAGDPSITAFSYADGPSGIRGAAGATAFPTTIALAASADRELAADYGAMLARELFAAGHNVLLGPGVDLARDPRAGRIGESLGEDPLLAGELAGTVVSAVHAEGALTVLKHYVGNNVERLRTGSGPVNRRSDAVNVLIADNALHETYLAPFRRAVRYGARGLMGSYNRLNGEYVCQSTDLLSLPRLRWGYEGFIVPDFIFAVRDPQRALLAGLDLPGLEGAAGRTIDMVDALESSTVERMAANIRSAAEAVHLRAATGQLTPEGLGTPDALSLAERMVIAGSVLLRNEAGALPLAPGTRIALIGAHPSTHMSVGGSGSVTLTPARMPDLEEELLAAGFAVDRIVGSLGDAPLPPLRSAETPSGIQARLFDEELQTERFVSLETFAVDGSVFGASGAWSAVVITTVLITESGLQRFSLDLAGDAELLIDGEVVVAGSREASPMMSGPSYPLHAVVDRQRGDQVSVTVRYRSGSGLVIDEFGLSPHLSLGHRAVSADHAAAAAVAERADVAVVLVGRVSGEAMDVDGLRLPADQEHLIAAVAGAAPVTIVVVASANPVVMPWRHSVNAIVHVWQPGERLAPALSRMLAGAAEPGGRLSLTFPETEDDLPFDPSTDARELDYAEGSAIGYRGYEERALIPAFAFGHGLGYADVAASVTSLDAGGATVDLTCGGDRGGKAVLYLFARVHGSAHARLCGWATSHLDAGERRTVSIPVDRDALGVWDAATQRLSVPEGPAEIMIGWSREQIVASASVQFEGALLDG